MRVVLGLVLGLTACASPLSIDRSALRHEAKADRLAELGDGRGAARQRQIALSRRLAADERAQRASIWVQSEWRME